MIENDSGEESVVRARPRILLPCSGLDHAYRGFETFARECFAALRDDARIDIELVKSSGKRAPGERIIPTFRRDRAVALVLGRARKVPPGRIEALAFGLALAPLIVRRRPDVIFLSEWDTARALAWLRSVSRMRFKLLLSNGSMAWTGFDHLDCVQQLTPGNYEYVMDRGGDPTRHVILPLGFQIPPELTVLSTNERNALRTQLGLPRERQIIVSVAAINRQHKRIDYVIEEVASLPEPRPFLLLVGQPEEDTPALRALARERLGESGHDIRTVPPDEVADLCRASDAFVLASLYEGLPRALVEAAALGLPCLVHSYPVTDYAVGPYGYSADLTRSGALAALISNHVESDVAPDRAQARHAYVYDHFSWDRLRPRYIELLLKLSGTGRQGVKASD